MPEVKNTFTGGKMNQDLDSRLLPKGDYREALNAKSRRSAGSDQGAIENNLSTKQLTNISLGANPVVIGMYFDNVDEKIYWFVTSDTQDTVVEYEVDTQIATIVLGDSSVDILNFDKYHLITGVNVVVDSDTGVRLLMWNDNLNPPRQINIERAKTYGLDNFDNEDISLIKRPPLYPPMINLSNTVSEGTQNNIEERFIRFAHRYEYLDGEFSALSPFTEIAFLPTTFLYDYAISSNESMVNAFNQVDIAFSTGGKLVKSIDVVFKDSNNSTVYIIDNYIKSEKGWGNDQEVNIQFVNNKIFKALDGDQLKRLYDAVPLRAKSQEIIGNRLVLGNYTENYNLEDCDGAPIAIDFVTELDSLSIVEGIPTPSLKSNRDYEIGIAYTDGQGRMTTVLTSDENTIFVPNSSSVDQNRVKVTVNNLAPCWATNYRFFIKYTKPDYDAIVPTIFYNDGIYVWVLLQGNEVNKVNEGEFLYVKSDTQQILPSAIQTRVLEVVTQPEDFLANGGEQVAGTYIKVKPRGYTLNQDDYVVFDFYSYDDSSNAHDDPIRGQFDTIELASYYGTSGLNDMTSSGTYVGSEDIRYLIEIDSLGAPDTFRWSDDDGQSYTTGVAITGAAQTLSNGVQVTFAATTGHLLTDNWVVSAKADGDDGLGGDMNSKAYAIYASIPSNGNLNVDDYIRGGTRITLSYSESGEGDVNFSKDYISSRKYDNLEEWWFGDDIQSDFVTTEDNVWFRRGTTGDEGAAKYFTQTVDGDMTLLVRSIGTQNNDFDDRIRVSNSLNFIYLNQNLIFETIPSNNNLELFNEIGRTYDIDGNRNHLGYNGSDVDQDGVTPAELILEVFNSFSWGNGFESYKIKDLFNEINFKLDTRPSAPIEDYRQNIRIASLTYSKVYEQSTNFNGLNEFNLSTANYKDLDDKYESIQKLHSKDTNLTVFQEDKVIKVPYAKDVLYTASGDGNVTASNKILGTEVAYTGEYGISTNPESFASYGNSLYFTDVRRGAVLRLNLNGIVEISKMGMEDFFGDSFNGLLRTKKVGAFDTNQKQYVLHVDDEENPSPTSIVPCGSMSQVYEMDETVLYTLSINASTGSVTLSYDITGTVNIKITDDGVEYDQGDLTGTGDLVFDQIDTSTELLVELTPITDKPTISLDVPCPIDLALPVVANDDISNFTSV